MALQREVVVRTALALLDEVGLDGLTMRRLATELGVQNPALYYHFKNKQDLLNQMAETMLATAFAGVNLPPTNDAWRDWLKELARTFRRALLSHRDGARVIAEADLVSSPVWVGLDLALGVLQAVGFPSGEALVGLLAIFDYTMGATYEEQADPHPTPAELAAGATLSDQMQQVVDHKRLPNLAAALAAFAREAPGHDRGYGFEGGIQLIIAGMEATRRRAGD